MPKPLSIMAKLMDLDYLLSHPGRSWLAAEHEKLAQFVAKLGLEESDPPVRIYASGRGRKTERRFFVEKYPIFVEAGSCFHRPVVSLCYEDEGALSTSDQSFSDRFRELFWSVSTSSLWTPQRVP